MRNEVEEQQLNETKIEITEDLLDFKQLVEYSLNSMIVLDETKIIHANKAALQMLNLKKEDLINSNFHDYLDQAYHEQCRERLYHVIVNGEMAELQEQRMIRKNGEVFDVEVMASPLEVSGQTFALLNINDIKERKEAERLLIQSEKLSMLGEIAAGIVHEIRNPLTSLKGFLHLMQIEQTGNPKYIDIMKSELERIETIANDLLKYSKPQTDTYKHENIVTIIEDVLFLLDTEIYKNTVTVQFSPSNKNSQVVGDKPQLKQVFLNLMKNAIDATSPGYEITIKVIDLPDSVVIEIKDQGCGIPQEQIQHLGTSFFTTKKQGTGLGLMVSFNIIKNHKGKIDVSSQEGKGSTFTITLPRK